MEEKIGRKVNRQSCFGRQVLLRSLIVLGRLQASREIIVGSRKGKMAQIKR